MTNGTIIRMWQEMDLKLIFIVCLVFSSLATLPVAEGMRPEDLITISPEKEKKMGASIAKQVEKQFDDVDDPLVQVRFEELGKKLARVCDRQEFVYHFKVLKAKDNKERYYNAFALPGGYVYMFDALLEALGTDDKIAAVIAHELAHISCRHAVERLRSSLGINALMLLAIATARDGRTMAEANEALAQLMMSYSREDEFEADKISVKYLKEAGFNPEGALESLLTLQELRKEGTERRYTHYKSHPYLSERIAAARAEIQGYADFDSYINLPEKNDGF